MLGYELVLAVPALLVTIYGVYEYGLARHPRLATAAIVVLATVLAADVAVLAYHLSGLPFSD
jgi:hypothetical protein